MRPSKTPDTISGIAKEVSGFSCVKYLDDLQLSDGLLSGSIKNAAVIVCSDMGSSIPYLCSSPHVKLFLFQNFGHSFAVGGLVETIVGHGVQNVLVYGHSDCNYTKFLASSGCDRAIDDVLQLTDSEQQSRLYSAAMESDTEKLWDEVGRYNILLELKKMVADPVIGALAAKGRLSLHGWFYKSADKQLEVFDPREEAFISRCIENDLDIPAF